MYARKIATVWDIFLHVKMLINLSGFFYSQWGSVAVQGPLVTSYRENIDLFRSFPATPLYHSRNLKTFKLTWRPSRAPDSPDALLSDLQRYKDSARCAMLGSDSGGQIKVHPKEP